MTTNEIKKIEFSVRHSGMSKATQTFKAMKMGITKAIRPRPQDAPQTDLQLFIQADFTAGYSDRRGNHLEELTVTCNGSHGDYYEKTYTNHELKITLNLNHGPNTTMVAVEIRLRPTGAYDATYGEWVNGINSWTKTQTTSCELDRFDFDKFFTHVKRLCSMTSYMINLDPINFSL